MRTENFFAPTFRLYLESLFTKLKILNFYLTLNDIYNKTHTVRPLRSVMINYTIVNAVLRQLPLIRKETSNLTAY